MRVENQVAKRIHTLPGGELAQLVQERDWSNTPLGPPEQWPQSLRTTVNILLTSRYAMWMGWGDQLTFLYNDAYRPTLGIKHPWALGTAASEVWAEIWPDIGPRIQTVLSTGKATYDEGLLLFLERSGFPEETYHTFSYSPLFNDDGQVSGMLCVVMEETQRILHERRMKTLRDLAAGLAASTTESEVLEAARRHLIANTKDLPFTLTYLFDPSGRARLADMTGIAEGHPAAAHIIAADANAPWPAKEMFHDPVQHVVEALSTLWQGSAALPMGAWDKAPEQAVVLPIKQHAHDRPAGFLVVGLNPYRPHNIAYGGFLELVAGQIAAGIASAKAYEEERRRAEVLLELDRAKTVFFSNVSHEFRTPLTLMLGPVEDLLSKPESQLDPANRDLLKIVHRNGLRLQRLVNALLDFSRIESGRVPTIYKPTDLASFTTELASSFSSAMERAGLNFIIDCPPLAHTVYVDHEMWEKIVLNLVSNAFKYTLQGSVCVRLIDKHGSAELSVTDTGVGIPEQELPHVFERFHRVENSPGRTHEGTGIGLALVQELVKLHSGTITASSKVGEGSTFTVSLPLGLAHLPQDRIQATGNLASTALHPETYIDEVLRWLPDVDPAAPPDLEADQQHFAGRSRVLLVEDNPDMREYVRRLLSSQYEVTTAANGEDALTQAGNRPPDLVLSDVMMPVLDGFGLLHALRSNPSTRTVPVILLSARAGEEASVEGLKAGADDYLVKPFTARELLARVGAHLTLKNERQRAQERLNQVLSQAPVGIVVFRGRDFIVELANPAYQAILEGRDLVGRKFADVVPELGERIWAALNSVLDTGQPFVANEFLVPYDFDQDGQVEDHWFNVVYHPLRDADGAVSGLVAVCSEVTTQVRARQELEKVNRELEEFAYVASHDLQEPLRMVNIYTELLLRRHVPSDNPDAQQFAGFIADGVRRMEQLIRDLLSYSRALHRDESILKEEGTADLNASWAEALAVMNSRILESAAEITAEDLPKVRGDSTQLAHVFQNLLSNALKYRKPNETPRIRVSAERREGLWVVAVRDNGIGFEQRYADGIFGLFKRLHRNEYPGTGLGLAICQRIVERYQGRIWAQSEPGIGSTFFIALPGEPEKKNVLGISA